MDSLFTTLFASTVSNAVSHKVIMCGRAKQIQYIAVASFVGEFADGAKDIMSSAIEKHIKA